ncbi:bifunctional aspartate aminotransferase and glutamate/aspartate-prephenate aminotransferase [Fistulifera solaris]|uniref:Bifunctional aspartate aminotransferase and glutamate/aspartate-prephenate aminotransferase n=1 Tax=Fistulifera solaris TaxID=1519565 RepID=A0A1Z5JQG7_FISSO|nr:bifunctional aspartate aminotransferase and glutamate/aspartate-prephenate aminotransferase [Fistulifera solaris]|eukprot:GAX16021.1 bifunctional aspartate aminotransferase and glutamate/aspartate-prephenate aminotransferase [Fistulifera solaris]
MKLLTAILILSSAALLEAWLPSLRPIRSSSELRETTSVDNKPYLNPLIDSIQPSKTVEIFSQVKDMEANGIHVTSLCVGEPDFLPAPAVLDALAAAVKEGDTRYTAVTGTLALRKAIAADLERRKGVKYNPANEIVVGNGAKQSVYQALLATSGVGDAVIIPAPYWPSYPEMVSLAGSTSVIVETKAETGYLMTAEQLRTALNENPSTKLIILCNPSNPTGGVYSKQQLAELCDVLQDFPQVKVLADEIYERLVYDIDECPSVASMPGMFSRTMTVNGFSKAHAMTGLRLGYVAAPAPIARAITTIQSQLTSCASSLSQAGGVAALEKVSDEEIESNVQLLKQKRDYVLAELNTMDGVKVAVPPQGAFYVLPDFSYYGDDDTQLCLDLLQEQKLALVPGSSFGAPGTIRISYATSLEELAVAMTKLRAFLEARQK